MKKYTKKDFKEVSNAELLRTLPSVPFKEESEFSDLEMENAKNILERKIVQRIHIDIVGRDFKIFINGKLYSKEVH